MVSKSGGQPINKVVIKIDSSLYNSKIVPLKIRAKTRLYINLSSPVKSHNAVVSRAVLDFSFHNKHH